MQESWLQYGSALNEGREMFPEDDKGFGQWLVHQQLAGVEDMERLAAMWAAEDLDKEFGQWVNANLADTHPHDRAAAMWAEALGVQSRGGERGNQYQSGNVSNDTMAQAEHYRSFRNGTH